MAVPSVVAVSAEVLSAVAVSVVAVSAAVPSVVAVSVVALWVPGGALLAARSSAAAAVWQSVEPDWQQPARSVRVEVAGRAALSPWAAPVLGPP